MANEGMMLLVGLGALLLLGGRKTPSTVQETITGSGSGFPGMFPPEARAGFDIQSYIDTMFGEMATVPVQPPMHYFFYPNTVVTSSGVPAKSEIPPDLITDTTKVQIGGDGGRTIVNSSLAIIRSEQVAKQEFAHAANADLRTAPEGKQYFWEATVEANRIEEARMKQYADDLIRKNIAAQARTRQQQEDAVKVTRNEALPPTINYDAEDEEVLSFGSTAGQEITVSGPPDLNVDFTPEYTETFVLSGGMDSPMVYFSEDEQPSTEPTRYSGAAIQAQYDVGF